MKFAQRCLLCFALAAACAVFSAEEPASTSKAPTTEQEGSAFRRQRAGSDMADLAAQLGAKMSALWDKRKDPARCPHLTLLLDTSSSACRLLVDFDQHIATLFKSGPRDLRVSVMALRDTCTLLAPPTGDVKELRRAVRQLIEESKNAQIRAKLQLNPAQRHQIQAWDHLLFITPDDCVKDWCGGVRNCIKELHKDYALDAVAVFTLDNADTENDVEALAAELSEARVSLLACAPDTLLTPSDPMPAGKRAKFFESCKKQLKLEYGERFIFHRRESAINEVIPVSGLSGPVECVGNTTGYGYYGLSRAAYATNGTYFIIADPQRPQCACLFHGPGDRFTGGNAADAPVKPGPPPGFRGKDACPPILPSEFDPDNQKKYEPCLLSREEVCAIYQASPYYRYLFSLWHGQAQNANYDRWWRAHFFNADEPWKHWSWGEGEYPYGAFLITPWNEGPARKAANAAAGKEDTYTEGLEPLRIHTGDRHAPTAWNYDVALPSGLGGAYAHFYLPKALDAVKTWLDGAIKSVEKSIADVRAGMPTEKPTAHCHRAIAELNFFLLALENQLFYLRQYRNYLDDMTKDAGVQAIFAENANEETLKKRLEEAQKLRAAGQPGHSAPYARVDMPRLLKQRCEEFAKVMDKRPPIYLGGDGRGGLDRFLKTKEELCRKVGVSTWTNFFNFGWQRQYQWVRVEPSWGGHGGHVIPPRAPVPPSYEPPYGAGPAPTGPSY